MKNNVILIFLLVGLLLVSACFSGGNSIAKSDGNLPLKENINAAVPVINANGLQTQDKTFKTIKIDSAQPLAWIGTIEAENLEKPKANGNIWSNAKIDDDKKYNQTGTSIEVDIMNCAGFLISGKLNKEDDFGWVLETMPQTAAKDAPDKIKQCDSNSDGSFPISDAFAVAPRDNRRQNIRIGKVDTRQLFASLPDKEKKWLDKKLDLPKEYQRVEKANLNLREDNWTDINGDGEIDLLMLTTVCRADDSEGDRCGIIFLRSQSKWIEIGATSKA